MPLRHEEASKAALRLALTDGSGGLAEAVLSALKPEKTESVALPSLLTDLRSILDAAAPGQGPAVDKLVEFLDRLDGGGPVSGAAVTYFD